MDLSVGVLDVDRAYLIVVDDDDRELLIDVGVCARDGFRCLAKEHACLQRSGDPAAEIGQEGGGDTCHCGGDCCSGSGCESGGCEASLANCGNCNTVASETDGGFHDGGGCGAGDKGDTLADDQAGERGCEIDRGRCSLGSDGQGGVGEGAGSGAGDEGCGGDDDFHYLDRGREMAGGVYGIFRPPGASTVFPEFTEEARQRIALKYPGRVPVLMAKHTSAVDLPDLPKQRFLVPSDLSLGQFVYVVRKHLTIAPEKALFLFVANTLQPSSVMMNELYHRFGKDGALRIIYTSEATFG
jgi:GABA(A) receptor-associated protein